MAEPNEVSREKRFRRYLRQAQSVDNIPLRSPVVRTAPVTEQVASEAPVVQPRAEVAEDRELPTRINFKIDRRDTDV